MNPQRLIGLAMLVGGVVLAMIGMNSSHSIIDRFSNFFTGHFTDATAWYIIGGVAAAVVGLSIAVFGGGKTRA